MQHLNNKNTLLDFLAQGAVAITPNNRLSASLLKQFFSYNNQHTIDKPICLPYNTLVVRLYQQLKFFNPKEPHPDLLSEFQCQHLWQNIIKADPTITYNQGLLRTVMDAWEHSQQWQINSENPAFHYTPQTHKFQTWWGQFNKQLDALNLICEHQLIPYLIQAECTSLWTQPIIWVCFDDFNPQQLRLQHYLSHKGCSQYQYDLNNESPMPTILAAADTKEEYQQLILWLQSKLNQEEQAIGVVVPDLEKESSSLQRTLVRHFNPALFDISLGQKLSTFPLVAHAHTLLQLGDTITNHQACQLLQSPYLGDAQEEFLARSQYLQDSDLLKNQRLSLRTLIHDLGSEAPKLSLLLEHIKPYPQTASPQEWVHLYQERLNTLGFPGDYGLNSTNYQCFNRMIRLFDEFRQLSRLKPVFNATEAIEAFIQLTDNTIFQAQKTNAPIQISGLLEASGCEFDSLWVMSLTDQCLPQKTHLSPFIPAQLQRDLLMPHSTPTRELQFAKQTLQRLQRGSQETVFSYSRLQGDNPNLPCSLIDGLPAFKANYSSFEITPVCALITAEETYSIPLDSEERISGGTALLANQAKCPFKAFAEHRLKASPPSRISEGLDPKEKGQVVHKIMELLWRRLNNQQQLLHLNPQELNELIESVIHTALTSLKQARPEKFPALVEEIEYIRLKKLVLSSLEWEKQRPPFSIATLEESYSINLAGLDFKVRVDRLDQVGDKKWIIDYKNSLPTSSPWNEDRPKEPQLLLYALLDEHINTLLFMQLKTGQFACKGLSEQQQNLIGINSLKKEMHWKEQADKWQQQLTLLAEEVQQGHCPPQPLQVTVCQQCDFQNLCRFKP